MATDERLTAIEEEEEEALKASDEVYDGMLEDNKNAESAMKEQIDANRKEQEAIQQEQTDFTIDQVEQKKEQEHKDYQKEQSGAYADWQKQSNAYGVEAEKQAASGLTGTGYSESSQVAMYNQYQVRVTAARESYKKAVLEYDNAIRQAVLQNNAVLAEIASQALAKKLEIAMSFVAQNNSILGQKASAQLQVKQLYQSKWQTMLNQINQEKALALQREQFEWQKEQAEKVTVGAIKGGDPDGKDETGGDTVDTEKTGGITPDNNVNNNNSGGKSEKYDAIHTAAGKITTNAERATWLDECVKAGTITEPEADRIYKDHYDFTQSTWSVTKSGGKNWLGGVNGNAEYQNELGQKFSGNSLFLKMQDILGTGAKAKEWMIDLQKQLGTN